MLENNNNEIFEAKDKRIAFESIFRTLVGQNGMAMEEDMGQHRRAAKEIVDWLFSEQGYPSPKPKELKEIVDEIAHEAWIDKNQITQPLPKKAYIKSITPEQYQGNGGPAKTNEPFFSEKLQKMLYPRTCEVCHEQFNSTYQTTKFCKEHRNK